MTVVVAVVLVVVVVIVVVVGGGGGVVVVAVVVVSFSIVRRGRFLSRISNKAQPGLSTSLIYVSSWKLTLAIPVQLRSRVEWILEHLPVDPSPPGAKRKRAEGLDHIRP